jgi:hypothetical protein
MLVLPVLIFPLVLVLALQKLYQIPQQLWRAELHFCAQRRGLWVMVCGVAYLALLGCTLRLGLALVQAGWASDEPLSAFLAVLGWVAAYPCIYVGAAWAFYHGLKPRPEVVD